MGGSSAGSVPDLGAPSKYGGRIAVSWQLLVLLFALVVVWVMATRWRRPPAVPHDAPDDDADEDAPRVLPIEDAIDLHGFAPRDVPSVVESYLEAAAAKGYREVRLIHGRGKGVQRKRVRELLAGHPLVESFGDAPGQRGGWGATLVQLVRQRRS